MELPKIENHTVVAAGDRVIASPDRLKQYIDPLIDAIGELNAAIYPLVYSTHDPDIIVEMHPRAFRDLMFSLQAHLQPHHYHANMTSKPSEFRLYNILFRAVSPKGKHG